MTPPRDTGVGILVAGDNKHSGRVSRRQERRKMLSFQQPDSVGFVEMPLDRIGTVADMQ